MTWSDAFFTPPARPRTKMESQDKMTVYAFMGFGFAVASVASFLAHFTFSGPALVKAQDIKSDRLPPFDVIVDTRTRLEWNVGHHPDAKHLPVTEINEESAKKIIGSKNLRVLVYCNTGQRARIAAEKLRGLGYAQTNYIAGPYTALL